MGRKVSLWGELVDYYRTKTKLILRRDLGGLERLARLHRRTYHELLDIISTKAAQLHLFGYEGVLNIIFGVSHIVKSSELLYVLVTLYHKYLISAVLDYAGGVVIWLSDPTPPGKLGLKPDPRVLEPHSAAAPCSG